MGLRPIAALQHELRELRVSLSGQRFTDGWQRRRGSRRHVRLLLPLVGGLLIVAGVVMLVVPGPGLVGIVLGLAVASSTVRPIAHFLDRMEVWGIRQYHRVPLEVRQSRAAKVGAAFLLLLGAATAAFSTWWVSAHLLS